MAVQVFVSYSRKDQLTVAAIVRLLENEFVVWWDDDLVSGIRFEHDIFKQLGSAQVAVVVWSKHSANSEWVHRESSAAVKRSLTIPVLLDETPLPHHLAHLDAIDLRAWDGASESRELAKLVRDITLHTGALQKPKGFDVAGAHLDGAELATAPNLGTGLLLYLIAVGIALYFLDWRQPFDNPFVLLILTVANYRVILNCIGKIQRCSWFASIVPLRTGLAAGGRLAVWVAISIWVANCSGVDLTSMGFFGEQASVEQQLRKVRPTNRDPYSITCLRLQRELPKSPLREFTSGLRPLSEDEALVALGCVNSPWNQLSPTSAGGISSPPFVIDLPKASAWAVEVLKLVQQEKYDQARLLLAPIESKDPAARNFAAVLDALQLGRMADPKSAFRNFRLAAQAGNIAALANLGTCYLFVVGVTVDPIYGSELIKQSIAGGTPPERATWLLQNGPSLLQGSDFAEVIKTVHLEAQRGSAIAQAIEGVLAARGLTKDPCAPKCTEVARDIAKALGNRGENSLAALVEMNVASERGRDAVNEAAQRLPAEMRRSARERFGQHLSAEQELRRAAATDPVRRAVEAAKAAR